MSGQQAEVTVIAHGDLSRDDLTGLQELFDAEYSAEYGLWSPHEPYGYAGHDVHVIARQGGSIIGHVGWGRRSIRVGTVDVVIAGVGGVLVSPRARGTALGHRLMDAAVEAMRRDEGVDFGYLGCREAVASFYEACGWTRVVAAERYVDRLTGETAMDPPGPPLLIVGIGRRVEAWPEGDVDVRGRPW